MTTKIDPTKLLKRTDKQVYNVIKTHGKPITLIDLSTASDLRRRTLQRALRRLRLAKLVRGVREGTYTFYEDIA